MKNNDYEDRIDPTTRLMARYFTSNILGNLPGKIDKQTGSVTFKDSIQGKPCLVRYDFGESMELNGKSGDMIKASHAVKKVFSGEIVHYDL